MDILFVFGLIIEQDFDLSDKFFGPFQRDEEDLLPSHFFGPHGQWNPRPLSFILTPSIGAQIKAIPKTDYSRTPDSIC